MNPAAGLKVLTLPFDHERTDVLIGTYDSPDAAGNDYQAATNCGAYLHAAMVVHKHADGSVSIEQSDHMALEGAQALGTIGLITGLVALRSASVTGMAMLSMVALTTSAGAAAGGLLGQALHTLVRRKMASQTATTVPPEADAVVLAYPRSSAQRVELAVTHSVNCVVAQAQGHHVQALRKALAKAQHDMATTQPVRVSGDRAF